MTINRVFSGKVNVISNLASSFWTAATNIVFVPFYLKYIGVESYGIIGIFSTLQAFIFLLDFGLSPTFNRELARLSSNETNAQVMHDLKRTLELPNWAVGVVIAVFLSALSPLIARFWVRPDTLSVATVTQALIIISITISLQFSMTFYAGGLMGLQRQLLLGVINIISVTFRSVGAIAVLAYWSASIQAFLAWQCLATLLQITLTALALRKSLPEAPLKGHFRKDLFSKIWRFAAGMTAVTFVSLILTQTDKVILSRMLSLEMFGFYTLAVLIGGTGIGTLVGSVTQAVYPRLSQLMLANDEAELSKFYHRSCQIVSVFVFPAAMILFFFSFEILLIWTRNERIAQETHMLLSLVAVGTMLNSLMILPYFLQLAHGTTKILLFISAIAIIVLIPLIIVGVSFYGAVGGALGWVVLNASYLLVAAPLMHKRVLSGGLKQWYIFDLLIPFTVSFTVVIAGKWILWSDGVGSKKIAGIFSVSIISLVLTGLSTKAIREQIVNHSPPALLRFMR